MEKNDFVTPQYETIGVEQKRHIIELANSSLLNAFTVEDYRALILVFINVVERLESMEGKSDERH